VLYFQDLYVSEAQLLVHQQGAARKALIKKAVSSRAINNEVSKREVNKAL
jgi:hypothetical protein